jgi:hypothetical protein
MEDGGFAQSQIQYKTALAIPNPSVLNRSSTGQGR